VTIPRGDITGSHPKAAVHAFPLVPALVLGALALMVLGLLVALAR
jgi:hypothetical protein